MTKTTPTRSRRPSKRRAGRAEDEQRARTLSLALNLSDDLVEAARELFGENVDYTSYSRKRAAEHQLRRFINPN